MNNRNNIDTIVAELDHIYDTYQRYVNFDSQTEKVKSRHRAEKDAITSATKDKMKSYEKKRRTEIKASSPTLYKALWTPIPALPLIPISNNHTKTIIMGAASGLAIPVGLVLYLIGINAIMYSGLAAKLLEFFSGIGGVLLLGGLVMWFFLGGGSAVEDYLNWQKEIPEYDKQMKEWECAYSKLDPIQSSNKLVSDVAEYEKEFLSMVKDCDAMFAKLRDEMLEEKSKLSKQHHTELEQLDEEWKGICNELESALERGRANTLQEAINIAIDDERLAKEEAARQAEARRQEAILQRQAEDNRRHNEELERAAREQAREAARQTQIAQDQAREAARRAQDQAREAARAREAAAVDARREAERRCYNCANYGTCNLRFSHPSNCSGFRPR